MNKRAKKWFKILGILFVIGIVSAFLVYKFVINKPHPDYAKEKAEYTLSAKELYNQYSTDSKKASIYNGKVVQISGIPNKTEKTDSLSIVVFVFGQDDFGDKGIRCTMLPQFISKAANLDTTKTFNIKGYCTGFNETDVIIDKCSFVE